MSSDKTLLVLNDKELMEIERIKIDRDPEEALEFVLKSLIPKIKEKKSCSDSAREIYRTQG